MWTRYFPRVLFSTRSQLEPTKRSHISCHTHRQRWVIMLQLSAVQCTAKRVSYFFIARDAQPQECHSPAGQPDSTMSTTTKLIVGLQRHATSLRLLVNVTFHSASRSVPIADPSHVAAHSDSQSAALHPEHASTNGRVADPPARPCIGRCVEKGGGVERSGLKGKSMRPGSGQPVHKVGCRVAFTQCVVRHLRSLQGFVC